MPQRHRPAHRRPGPALALAFALVASGACHRVPEGPPPPEGELHTALALPTLAGPSFDPAALLGKRVMVTFWSPTCHYCLDELPVLQALAAEHPRWELVTVLIGERDRAASAVAALNLAAPVLIDDGALRARCEVSQTPTTLLLDEAGVARRVLVGAYPKDTLERALRSL